MDFIEWDDRYVTGEESIDQDHKVLVEIINRLHAAMLRGTARNKIEGIIDELVDYTNVHFAREEEVMAKARYEGLPGHKRLHEHFVSKSVQFQDDFKEGKIGLSVAIFTFLKDWLTNHILEIDKNMVEELH